MITSLFHKNFHNCRHLHENHVDPIATDVTCIIFKTPTILYTTCVGIYLPARFGHGLPVTYFHILSIPEAILQGRAFKYNTVRALNSLIKRGSGFDDIRKLPILPVF